MLARGDDVLWRAAPRGILVQIADGEPVRLEPAASLLWMLLEAPASRDELDARLADAGAEPPSAEQLANALDELIGLGVLVER